jgi:hypothetical protein
MIARLGNVVYWADGVIGALFLMAAVAGALFGRSEDRLFTAAMFVVIAALS